MSPPETKYFQEKWLQGNNRAKNWTTMWEWCRLCLENKWVSLCFLWFARVKPCASFVPWARLLRCATNWVCSMRSRGQTDRRTATARRMATIRLPEVHRLDYAQPQRCSRSLAGCVTDTCLENLLDYPAVLGPCWLLGSPLCSHFRGSKGIIAGNCFSSCRAACWTTKGT